MKTWMIALGLGMTVASGCASADSAGDFEAPAGQPASVSESQYQHLVGRWQFIYDGERRAAVEAEIAAKITDPTELAKAKAETADEAAQEWIELTADKKYVVGTGP